MQARWFGLFPVRSPLLGKSIFLSLPVATEMFQFTTSAAMNAMYSRPGNHPKDDWVPPFGNLRIKAYVQLPGAYRCLSRPSSAPSAKASAVRPSSLDLKWSFTVDYSSTKNSRNHSGVSRCGQTQRSDRHFIISSFQRTNKKLERQASQN